jgi:hypothetical protein
MIIRTAPTIPLDQPWAGTRRRDAHPNQRDREHAPSTRRISERAGDDQQSAEHE